MCASGRGTSVVSRARALPASPLAATFCGVAAEVLPALVAGVVVAAWDGVAEAARPARGRRRGVRGRGGGDQALQRPAVGIHAPVGLAHETALEAQDAVHRQRAAQAVDAAPIEMAGRQQALYGFDVGLAVLAGGADGVDEMGLHARVPLLSEVGWRSHSGHPAPSATLTKVTRTASRPSQL